MIYETIISTVNEAGKPHITPFGIRKQGDLVMISPYKPSTTLDNILSTKTAVMNLTDDVRVFAGAIVKALPPLKMVAAKKVNGFRLEHTLAHQELILEGVSEDDVRPELQMRVVHEETHHPFLGFNRAQSAVIELAVLTSRLHMLPRDKVMNEMQYLKIAIDKTAGEQEQEAWGWLVDRIDQFYKENNTQ